MELSTSIPILIGLVGKITFSWYDYILFVLMLVLSTIIGIYFGCFGTKQSSKNEYLMGEKTMKVVPIAISLVASHTSGITLLGLPADVYRYGAAFWLSTFSMIIVCIILVYVYLPVFFHLQITSVYEYLEIRFDKKIRLVASFLNCLSVVVFLPVVIYVPALALSAATGIHIHFVAVALCGICIFYTAIGGLKAVVWTDTLQFTVTIGALVTVFILGLKSSGGLQVVWSKSVEGKRLDIFDFDINPTKRDAFWTILIGLTVHWIGYTCINQTFIQKYLAVPSLKKATHTVFYYGIGMILMKSTCILLGLIMYAKYSNCDPFTTKEVEKNDQLLPYFVMDVAGSIPGLPGLFIAGIVSAALSTLSATLNCLAGTVYEDFIKKIYDNDDYANCILKSIVVITGVLSTVLVLVVEHLGGVFPLAISLGGATHGPLLAMFTLGIFCPMANSKGVLCGAASGLIFICWVFGMTQYYKTQGIFNYAAKPISTEGCQFLNMSQIINITSTRIPVTVQQTENEAFFLFRISYYYYTLLGCLVSMGVGLLISYCTRADENPVGRDVLNTVGHFLLPDKQNRQEVSYSTVDTALKIVENNVKDDRVV